MYAHARACAHTHKYTQKYINAPYKIHLVLLVHIFLGLTP